MFAAIGSGQYVLLIMVFRSMVISWMTYYHDVFINTEHTGSNVDAYSVLIIGITNIYMTCFSEYI